MICTGHGIILCSTNYLQSEPTLMNARYLWSISVGAALAVAQAPCLAEAGDPLTDHFSVSLGTFLLDTSTDIRVDGEANTGTDIDLDTDLGFDDSDRWRIDG